MVEETVRRAGRLDVLVNGAAVAPAEAFLEMTAAAWEQALLVNVRAVALAMAAAGRVMAVHGGGRIVSATSAAARMALPNYAAYAATKAAVDSLTRSAAVALAPHGIRVNSLSPGMMDTPLRSAPKRSSAGWKGAPTSTPTRPSAPPGSRSAAAATLRRWRGWWSGLRPRRPTT